MIRGAIRLLFLIACLHQAISTEIEEVKPRWIYNKNNNSKTFPDLIQIDLKLESGKITLNLMKQSIGSTKLPLLISGLEGQRSILEPSENGLLGIYSDYSFDASATVAITTTDEIKETLYMVTFTHDDGSVSLGPSAFLTEDLNLGKDDEYNRNEGTKSRVLNINGVLHSLFESRRRKPGQNIHLARVYKTRHPRIRKRSTVEEAKKRLMTVEIFTLIDYAMVKKFSAESKSTDEERKRNDAITSIYYFFTHVMEGVRKLYENIEITGLKFTTKWVGAFIAENSEDLPFIEPGATEISLGYYTLHKFRRWVANQTANQDIKIKFPNYDLLITFTGVLMEDVYGIASRFGICNTQSVAIVQYDRFFNMIKTTAHEIAHLLGAMHDGWGNDCKSKDGYLMSEIAQYIHNASFFSRCSVSYFKNMIFHLDNSSNNCLTKDGSFSEHHEMEIFSKLLLGQIYDLDDQCKMEFGSDSLYIGGRGNYKVMCRNISCLNGDFKLIAMDGTPCSNKSWCLEGKCVSDSRAPRVPENCINGDKLYQVDSMNNSVSKIECKKNIKDGSGYCQSEQFRNDCCLSCAQNESMHRGCQDTLEECSMLDHHDCYHDYYASVCCKTCRFFVQNQSDTSCLYGDRVAGCLDMVPSVCHISSKLCCKTCAAYHSSNKQNGNTGFTPNPNNFSHLCSQGDFPDTLEYKTIWGENRRLKCNQLIDQDPSLCYNSVVQKYCCASCSAVKLVKDYCKNGDTTNSLKYFHKKFTCSQLVAYNPRLCEIGNTKNLCCESCGRFTIRPVMPE